MEANITMGPKEIR